MKLDEEKLRGMLCEMTKKRLRAALLSFALLPILVFALYFARAYGDREASMEPRVSHHVDLQLLYSFLVRGTEDSALGAPFKVYPIDVDKYHATLVEYPFGSSPRKVDSLAAPRGIVLYVHGFSDYFFQKEMAEKVDSAGYAFFAVDLHGYGRSARPGEPFSDMRFASEFFMEINYAMEMGWHLVKSEQEHRAYATVRDSSNAVITKAMLSIKRPPNVLIAHSQGGLISSLYLDEFQRDDIDAVVLNSPFLEMNYSLPVRKIAFPCWPRSHSISPITLSVPPGTGTMRVPCTRARTASGTTIRNGNRSSARKRTFTGSGPFTRRKASCMMGSMSSLRFS